MFINEGPEPDLSPSQQQFSFEAPVNEALTPKVRKSLDICQRFQTGACTNGPNCRDRHLITNQPRVIFEVCKFWLRGACLNGADCGYLHSFDERLIPECAFFAKLGECTNPECNFRHVHPEEKIPICGAYERGFCPYGPECHLRHVKRLARPCPFYMAGFCPLGANCTVGPHPIQQRYDRLSVYGRVRRKLAAEAAENNRNFLHSQQNANVQQQNQNSFNPSVTCFKCFDPGHTARNCKGGYKSLVFNELKKIQEPGEIQIYSEDGKAVGCFLCGEEGHTLKECPEERSELGIFILNLLVGGNHNFNNNNNNNQNNNNNNFHRNQNYQNQNHHHQNYNNNTHQAMNQSVIPTATTTTTTNLNQNPQQQAKDRKAELRQMIQAQNQNSDVSSVPAGFRNL
jgi:cleavage and polyadenylation specificity factor subunit 4